MPWSWRPCAFDFCQTRAGICLLHGELQPACKPWQRSFKNSAFVRMLAVPLLVGRSLNRRISGAWAP